MTSGLLQPSGKGCDPQSQRGVNCDCLIASAATPKRFYETETNSAQENEGLEDATEYGLCGQADEVGESVQGLEWQSARSTGNRPCNRKPKQRGIDNDRLTTWRH